MARFRLMFVCFKSRGIIKGIGTYSAISDHDSSSRCAASMSNTYMIDDRYLLAESSELDYPSDHAFRQPLALAVGPSPAGRNGMFGVTLDGRTPRYVSIRRRILLRGKKRENRKPVALTVFSWFSGV